MSVLAIAVAAALAPASASAWTDPAPISGADTAYPALGVGPGGDIGYAWVKFDGSRRLIQTRVERPDGGLSPVQTLASGSSNSILSAPHLAVDSAGDVVYVWTEADSYRMQLRIRYADGTLGPARLIAPPSHSMYGANVAMDPQGDGVITWTDTSNAFAPQIDARRFSVSGGLGPSLVVTRNYVTFGDDVAMDAAGDAFITWRGGFAGHTRVLRADGSLSPVQTLASTGYYPTVAVGANGNAVYAWQGNDGGERIQVRRRTSDGHLGPLRNVSAPSGYSEGQKIALGPGGKAVIAWDQTRLRTRTLRADGTLSAPQAISPPKETVRQAYDSSDVVVDSAGDDIYGWTASAKRACVRVRSSQGLGRVQCLTPRGLTAIDSRLAPVPTGGAVMVWTLYRRNSQSRLEASFGP